jgi:hypothetical protein
VAPDGENGGVIGNEMAKMKAAAASRRRRQPEEISRKAEMAKSAQPHRGSWQ